MNTSISKLLIFTRNQIIKARGENDETSLKDLEIFNKIFLDSAYFYEDIAVARILESFEDAIRDSFQKVEWKSIIPTEKEIRELEDK